MTETMPAGSLKPAVGLKISAILLALVGAIFAVAGARLAQLGGSGYYLIAGIATIVSAVLLWRRSVSGAWLYAAILAGTLIWAVLEAGFDGWALVPRVTLPLAFGLWLLTPWARRGFGAPPLGGVSSKSWLLGGFVVIVVAFAVMALVKPGNADAVAGPVVTGNPTEWRNWGNDAGGTRYATALQLTPQNVSELQPVWTFKTGAVPHPHGAVALAFESTPLKVGEALYFCSPHQIVYAVDAVTGQRKWEYDPKINETGLAFANCRGVSYHTSSSIPAGQACHAKIYVGTADSRLIAIDAQTGRPCEGFGNRGAIDLKQGLGAVIPGYYFMTSPPTVSGNVVVAGAFVLDGQMTYEPSGVIRGFDVDSGQLTWAFDPGKPNREGPLKPGEIFTPGTPNSWSVASSDEALGLIYLPFGAATPDYFGSKRSPEVERFSNAIVALDNKTGKVRWVFQVVHHDLWDYDISSQPVLTDFQVGGKRVPALITVSKSGDTFVLDRATGKPLSKVEERAVPQGAAPGDFTSPTQPFSPDLPNFAGAPLTERQMWGLTPFDQLWCRIAFKKSRYDGRYTPPSIKGSIQSPGFPGGVNWGSVSIDEQRDIMIVNSSRLPSRARLITRAEADQRGMHPAGKAGGGASVESIRDGVPQSGVTYAVLNGAFLSPLGVPCQQPPFGTINAVDLKTRKLLWTKRIGLADRMGPLGLPSMIPATIGLPTLGGSITTATGLTFIASTPDRRIRAYETATGKLLWTHDLPANGNATPMTYMARDGRQYLVIAAGGSAALASNARNVLVAFALPARK